MVPPLPWCVYEHEAEDKNSIEENGRFITEQKLPGGNYEQLIVQ